MTSKPRPQFGSTPNRVAANLRTASPAMLAAALLCGLATPALAQNEAHYRHDVEMAPGAIGREQLARGGPMAGYWQPVEIVLPDGGSVAFEVDGRFSPPVAGSAKVAMQIGYAYRLQVTGIPLRPGEEIYPTIELVSRLYPPAGQEWNFPVPIHLTTEELDLALEGNFVTRVVYLEDPNQALPVQDRADFQRYFEIAPTQEPLETADRLGRPMAVLRMGSRMPQVDPRALMPGVLSPPIWMPPREITHPTVPQSADPNLDLRRYPLPFAP